MSTKIVQFTASYAGTAVVNVTDQVADISATGRAARGRPSAPARSRASARATPRSSRASPSPAPARSSASREPVKFKVLPGSTGCGDEGGHGFTISAKTVVTGGTKAFAKAKGPLKLTGTYDRDAGTFTVKFSGKLTLPK